MHCFGDIASEVVNLGHVMLHANTGVEAILTLALNTPTYTYAYHDATVDGLTRLGALSDAYQATSPSAPRLHVNVNGEVKCYGIATAAKWVSCHDGRLYSMYPL